METCMVLGGTGFIGSHLVESLTAKGYQVKLFSDMKSAKKTIPRDVEAIKGDFLNENDLKSAIKDTDYLFHFISTTKQRTSINDPLVDINSNIIGSVRLFELAVKSDVKKIIFSSSGGTVYGEPSNIPVREADPTNPLSPYAISKLTIERYLEYYKRLHGLDYVILRYSNPYGEGQDPLKKQGIISVFLNQIKNGESSVIYGDGSTVKDYIYIKDAIDATLLPLKKSRHSIYNVGSGTGTSINELIEIISEITGRDIHPVYRKGDGVDVHKIVLDISRLRQEFGWGPKVNLKEGIERTWDWIKT